MSEVLAEYDALAARISAFIAQRGSRRPRRESTPSREAPDLESGAARAAEFHAEGGVSHDFDSLALDIHVFQRRWNEPYARFCATRAEPRTWREIPAAPLAAFKRFRLSCVPPEHIGTTFLTSGTTGEVRGAHHFRDTALYEAALLAGWRMLGLPRVRHVILDPPRAQSSLGHMLATLACERAETEPVAMLGTALAFLHHFETTPARVLPPSSFAMETGGYKGSGRDIAKAELYAMFERHLGLRAEDVINEYGMTELSSQFYTRGLGGVHLGGPWVRALVIDPRSGEEVTIGEMGVLRVFDLANLNSVLAIETQDLAVRREEGFELIGRDPAALPRGCSRAVDELLRR